MAKKVTALIKLQVNAGKATPAPPIGPALGQHGVNIPGFCKEFNDRTAKDIGLIIPVVITVYQDLSLIHICTRGDGGIPGRGAVYRDQRLRNAPGGRRGGWVTRIFLDKRAFAC